jgi:glutamine synthetase
VCAGLDGIRDGLEPPSVVAEGAELDADPRSEPFPSSLGEALVALESDPQARDWLPARLRETYVGLKRLELSLVSDLDEEEVCRLYAGVH